MALGLTLTLLTVFGVVSSIETKQKLWDVEADSEPIRTPDNSTITVSAGSAIECVITAESYGQSLATFDESTQTCFIYSTTDQNELLYLVQTRSGVETCADLEAKSPSGVYRITPEPGHSFDVYCDMDTEQGPWTVLQNRESSEVAFNRSWEQYKNGFGDLRGNFWLGNDHIYTLTRTPAILRIQATSANGTFGYVEYSEFQISNENKQYELYVVGFSGGNISDELSAANGMYFSTIDRDNDFVTGSNCAERNNGAWWFRRCLTVNLNGQYDPTSENPQQSMFWNKFYFQNDLVQLKASRMMLKKP